MGKIRVPWVNCENSIHYTCKAQILAHGKHFNTLLVISTEDEKPDRHYLSKNTISGFNLHGFDSWLGCLLAVYKVPYTLFMCLSFFIYNVVREEW